MDFEIRVDRTACMGSGQCVHWAPGVFEQDEESISVVVDPRGEAEEKVVQAVVACPVRAITLHVGDACVGPDDLKGWAHGLHDPDPVVERLEQLSGEHHDLRDVISVAQDDAARAEEMRDFTIAHLRNEERVYSSITDLIGPELVDSFEGDHVRIENALAALAAHPTESPEREQAIDDLASAVDDHIQLEETVLFPVALTSLARRAAR